MMTELNILLTWWSKFSIDRRLDEPTRLTLQRPNHLMNEKVVWECEWEKYIKLYVVLYIVWVVKTIFVRYDASCGLSSDHIQWWKICWRLESCVLLRDEESHVLPVFLCDACYWSFHHGPYKWWYLVVNNLRQNLNRWWCNSGFPMSSNIDCTIVFVWGYMRTHRVTIFSFVTCESYELFSCVCNLF